MIKGLIVGQTPPPENGSSRMAVLLAETLTSLGVEVDVVSKDFSKSTGEIGKSYIAKSLTVPKLINRLRSSLSNNPDVVVFFLTSRVPSVLLDVFLFWILHRRNRKVVLYLHTMGFSNLCKKNGLLAVALKSVFSKSAAVVTLGSAMEQEVKDVAPNARTLNIANYVLPETSIKTGAIYADRHEVLFVANMNSSKGIDTFLAVFGILAERHSDLQATIIGQPLNGNQIQQIKNDLEDSSVLARVSFLGYQKREVISDLFNKSIFLLYPSREDAQPLVILEAISLGLPVVASNVGLIPEILHEGAGFSFDPGDINGMVSACEDLIGDQILWESTSKRAMATYIDRYSLEVFRSDWSNLLNNLLETDEKR